MPYYIEVKEVSELNLHPAVQEFKTFINQHPKLIEDIRKNGKSWQEYYEKWVLLGEDDPIWENYKEAGERTFRSSDKTDWMNRIMNLTENVDLNKVQEQVSQLSGTVETLQELLSQFKKNEDKTMHSPEQRMPMNWFKD